jgi:flavin-dependent dehydrogenase
MNSLAKADKTEQPQLLSAESNKHRVVILGGGFGGLSAAQGLKNTPVEVTLIDRRNFHLFQPLLYQVATGWLSPANIANVNETPASCSPRRPDSMSIRAVSCSATERLTMTL